VSRWLEVSRGLFGRQWAREWYGTPFHLIGLSGRRPAGLAAEPHDLRPPDPARGQEVLEGRWNFVGETMVVGPTGDPWDRASPSRAFAATLHRMDWLGDLLAVGEPGAREALRLILDWRRSFGRWNGFAWAPQILERRVFNLACGLKGVCARASDLETAQLADSLARQARHLLRLAREPTRGAERACAAAIAGLALGGEAGRRIAEPATARLDAALRVSVLADGGHASRSPQAGLELLLDLLTLDDALSQRGRPPPDEAPRAMDRLAAALRLLTLPDGRLAVFQGGEAGRAANIAAARDASDLPPAPDGPAILPHAGYRRVAGKTLTLVADVARAARGAWSETACAQPLAIEVLAGAERLITNCGWSPVARAEQGLRLTGAGSTVSIGEASAGAPVHGLTAYALGPRLDGGAHRVEEREQESADGVWLDLAHDGWVKDMGLRHERLLFLDLKADELRGEDRLAPVAGHAGKVRTLPMAVRFQLTPQVRATLARDGKSVLIQGAAGPGWWLRNDATEASIEASVHVEEGEPKRSLQVVLRTQVATDIGGRIRWKLAPVTS
jgi:uncharacterized heparinase superfamily protein